MTFAEKVLGFYRSLELGERLPRGVGVLNPYTDPACMEVCRIFYEKFYSDNNRRFLILGINPGRHGAGVTGIPFTDPVKLDTLFGIPSTFPKKPELSADFIHAMISAFGGHQRFFSKFFINSVSPLGFVQEGKNLNYYDTPALKRSLGPFIRKSLSQLMELDVHRRVVFCLGEGANFKFIQAMNSEERWFDEIIPLAHPRFIMQYKRKTLDLYVDDYVTKLRTV